jgi:hypothetical protein
MSIKKIECLDILFKKLHCGSQLLEFLRDEHIIDNNLMARIIHEQSSAHSSAIFSLLENLQKENKVQLVDYQWTILPKEFIQLTIVTSNARKDFTFSV